MTQQQYADALHAAQIEIDRLRTLVAERDRTIEAQHLAFGLDTRRLDWIQKRGGKPWVRWKEIAWFCWGAHVDIVNLTADGKDSFPTVREAIDAAMQKEGL